MGEELVLFFDIETKLLNKVIFQENAYEFENYKMIGSILYPYTQLFSENKWIEGEAYSLHTYKDEIDEVLINAPIDTKIFKRPNF